MTKDKGKIVTHKGKEFSLLYHYQESSGFSDEPSVCMRIRESNFHGYKCMRLKDFEDIEKTKMFITSLLPKDPEETFDLEFKKWNGNL